MKKQTLIVMGTIIALISGCKKAELPVPKHNPGSVTLTSINMDGTYKWQIYFNLKNNAVVRQNLKTDWDLGFTTSASGYEVVLNGAKFMFTANTHVSDFTAITDTNGFYLAKKCDVPSGNKDSTAIGDWLGTNNIYIIDRGFNENGVHQGFRKIQLQTAGADNYIVRFAQLNGAGDTTLVIQKDSAYNFTFLSFTSRQTVMIEPPKANWDIVFTQYTHIFYNPVLPYLVTGCLLNSYRTKAIMDSTAKFANIDFNYTTHKTLSPALNTIGYEWKEYSFNTSSYTIYPQMNYILQNQEGLLFKLHFTGFYSSAGVKGNPQWEYQKL